MLSLTQSPVNYIADPVSRPQIPPSFILGSPRVTVASVCCHCGFRLSMRAQMAVGRTLLLTAPDISFQLSECRRFVVCWPGMERMTSHIPPYSEADSQKIAHQNRAFGFIIPFVTLREAGQWCGLGHNSSITLVTVLLPFIFSHIPLSYLSLSLLCVPFIFSSSFSIVASSYLLSWTRTLHFTSIKTKTKQNKTRKVTTQNHQSI